MTSVVSFVIGAALMFVVYRLLGGKLEARYPFLPSKMDGAGYARMTVGAFVAIGAISLVYPILKGILPN
jgi:hypothetical protein